MVRWYKLEVKMGLVDTVWKTGDLKYKITIHEKRFSENYFVTAEYFKSRKLISQKGFKRKGDALKYLSNLKKRLIS